MFGANKRNFLLLLIMLSTSLSWGCSAIVGNIGYDPADLRSFPQTRAEIREKFGGADDTTTCPGGQVVEHRWIRQKIGAPIAFAKEYLQTLGAVEIILFPLAIYGSEKSKLHYAFVYDETGRNLYWYDLKAPPSEQFDRAVRPLSEKLYNQLKEGKCDTWCACIADYVKEARQRADCIGYTLDAEEEREFEDLLTIGEWVDSGQVLSGEGLADIKEMPHRRFWFLD